MRKISNFEYRKISSSFSFSSNRSIIDMFEENNIKNLMKENSYLKIKLKSDNYIESSNMEINGLLGDLVKLFHQKGKKGYHSELKQISLFFYLIGGKQLYEALSANLNFPSLSTVKRHLASLEDLDYKDGLIRVTEFAKFLNQQKYPKYIFGSEDMTKIKPVIRYDSKNNSVVGLSAPLDRESGLPVLNIFEFDNTERVFELTKTYEIAPYVNTIMLQPLLNKSVAYPIVLYGSNNKFTYIDVGNRWSYLKKILKEYEIELYGKII
jgi:hypothetical protein